MAGGENKCKYVTEELKFDHCLDYKSDNFFSELKDKCKGGVDVYFDNVGGSLLNHMLIFISNGLNDLWCYIPI